MGMGSSGDGRELQSFEVTSGGNSLIISHTVPRSPEEQDKLFADTRPEAESSSALRARVNLIFLLVS